MRLFFAMLGIQVAIGALNDVIDAPLDVVGKPAKPIPAGLVAPNVARGVAVGGALVGKALSAVSGPATVAVGAACLGLGWIYDLRLSRTMLSWVPLAVALPLLPIHAWLGATGSVPNSLLVLLPIGVLAGGGLALANGLVDVERDALARRANLTVVLGRSRSWLAHAVAVAAAVLLAVGLAPGSSPSGVGEVSGLAELRRGGLALGPLAVGLGAVLLLARRATTRERGWELEAIGVVALGIGWIAGVSLQQAG